MSKADERRCRDWVYERAGGLCERCGFQGHSFHHRKKRGQGGPWSESNIVLLCGHGTVGCHHWVENHPHDAELAGFHIRPWNTPAEHPILLHGTTWMWLADGTATYTPVPSSDYDRQP